MRMDYFTASLAVCNGKIFSGKPPKAWRRIDVDSTLCRRHMPAGTFTLGCLASNTNRVFIE